MNSSVRHSWRGAAASVALALLVIASVWAPAVRHEFVYIPPLGDSIVEEARVHPPDEVLRRVGSVSLAVGTGIEPADRQRAADAVLAGRLELAGQPVISVSPRFVPKDLEGRPPTLGLQLASLVVVEIYLDAWDATRDLRYLDAAADYINEFAKFESRTWMTEGFLRNDHALAARIGVLARFWDHYRKRPDQRLGVARIVLEQVARCRGYLADASHFTAATNHGVMQNIALLQAAAAFPALPDSDAVVALAMRRLEIQMPFYLGPEGVVLEHSAGYHAHGLTLIDEALGLATILGQKIPNEWIQGRERAAAFLAALIRPDGSLPVYGNTSGGVYAARATDPCRAAGTVAELYPVSGYAIWRDCIGHSGGPYRTDAHTTVLWSHFPGHGHKLADEGSIVLWAAGRPWVTNVGYWPYGMPGRDHVDGWEGSNALHVVDEPRLGRRHTRIAALGELPEGQFIDLVRQGNGFDLRRQVVYLRPATWIVIDSAQATGVPAAVAWTIYPGATLVPSAVAGVWELRDGPSSLDVALLGAGNTATVLRASSNPFGGWTVVDGLPRPTTTLRRTLPTNGELAVSLFVVRRADAMPTEPILERADGPESWQVRIGPPNLQVTIGRRAGTIHWSNATQRSDTLVTPGPDITVARQRVREALTHATETYPRYRAVNHYRGKVTWALLGILVVQELLLLVVARVGRLRLHPLRVVVAIGWLALGLWLHGWYFAA